MKMRAIISTGILVTVMLILALCRPVPAFAVSTITTSSGGDGVFLVQGTGIEDAAAFEIIVSYDTATLANPRVVEGTLIAGAMTAINTNVPGTVRMVIIRLTPVKGSGVIATMTFDRKGSSPGKVLSLSAKLSSISGKAIAAFAQINNPSDTSTIASNSSSQNQDTSTRTASSGQTSTGTTGTPTVIIATGPPSKADEGKAKPETSEKESLPAVPETATAPEKEPVTAAQKNDNPSDSGDPIALAKAQASKIYTQKSILERFQEYKGTRTAEALIALFNRESMIGCRQYPLVAISDGKSAVKVTFISAQGNLTPSDVTVIGARMLSLSRDPDNTNTWVVKLVPNRSGYEASITVSLGELKMIYPLTITPRVKINRAQSGKATMADFDRSLNQRRTSKSSPADLNRDGQWDYRDDYILTANYLVALKEAQSRQSETTRNVANQ